METSNDNPYALPLEEAWELFGGWLDGPRQATLLAISQGQLSDLARNALERTFEALGWGKDACTFLSWPPGMPDGNALFAAVEGLDPTVLVIADEDVGDLLGSSCRCPVPYDACARFFGRECCAFRSFERMLESPQLKQKAWACLKRLPRANGE